MTFVKANVSVPPVKALASMPPVPMEMLLPPKVNEPAPLLKVNLLSVRPERLLFSARPEVPAAPKTSESPLATGPEPEENVQLPDAPQLASVLPTQVLVLAALADRVANTTPTNAPSRLFTDLFLIQLQSASGIDKPEKSIGVGWQN